MNGNASDRHIPEGFEKALLDLPSEFAWLAPAARHLAGCDPEMIEDDAIDLGPVARTVTDHFRERGEAAFDDSVARFGVWLREQPNVDAHLPFYLLDGLLLISRLRDWENALIEPAMTPPAYPEIEMTLPTGWKAKHKPGSVELRVKGGPKLVMITLVSARDLDNLVAAQLQGPSELLPETTTLGAWVGSVLIVRSRDLGGGVIVGGGTDYFLRADQQAWAIRAVHSGVHGTDPDFDREFESALASVRITPRSG